MHDGITSPEFSLINDGDPTDGIIITYINGDFCELEDNKGKNRELKIRLYCDKDNIYGFNIPDILEEEVYEDDSDICTYYIDVISLYGCPIECTYTRNGGLCDGKGTCEYQYNINKPKCFCYNNLFGDECELTINPYLKYNIDDQSEEVFVGVLILLIVIITLLISLIIYLVMRYFDVKILKKRGLDIILEKHENKNIKGGNVKVSNKELKEGLNVVKDQSDDDDDDENVDGNIPPNIPDVVL